MATVTRRPILISGAGLASLLLAQSLLQASIPFLIFERDSSISFRAQGYRLRLSAEGLDAIETVLGPERFQCFWDACSKTGGGGLGVINAITGDKHLGAGEASKPAVEEGSNHGLHKLISSLASRQGKVVGISRGEMRKQFMRGCEPYVKWSHEVTGFDLTENGVKAIFADGSRSVKGEMLIGGEGISSEIAKQLSGGKLKVFDTGARGIHGQAPTTAFKDLGEGVWRIEDDSNPRGKIFVVTNVRPGDMNDPDIQFGWTMAAQPGVISAPNNDCSVIGVPAAEIAKSLTANWHPSIKPLFEQMDASEAAFWKITCSTPTGVPEWPNHPRVTVIGDAVHSMTPAGGIGANTALIDSALLGGLLLDAGGFEKDITAVYERAMRIYGTEAVNSSYKLATSQFGVKIDESSKTI